MKKISSVFTFLIGLLILSSCSSDDDSNDNDTKDDFNTLIIGDWEYVSILVNGANLGFSDPCQEEFEYQVYTANGVYNQTEYEDLNGDCVESSPTVGSWSISGEKLTLNITAFGGTPANSTGVLTIVSLTKNTLSFKTNEVDEDGDGKLDEVIYNLKKK